MTQRLYYTDAGVLDFEARVVAAREVDGRAAVVLDRTAFYPTSGGQPYDTGTLGGVRVVEVIDEGDEILHVVDRAIETGAAVSGVVDADRRLDHMQQHTGQHVLSAAFDRLFKNRTLSFHMGADVSTIDLAALMSPEDVERAVDEANRVVWENRPVTVRFASADEARTMGLRKESVREGELRLVDVTDFDLSACGGTHVPRTGTIGVIAATSVEKFKGGMRVSFVCGGRVLRSFRGLRDSVTGSIRALSVLPAELPAAIQKLQAESKALRKRATDLQGALAVHEAARLVAGAPRVAGVAIVAAVVDGWDASGLKAIASAVLAHGPAAVALVGSDTPALVVAGRSVDVNPVAGIPGAGDLVKALTAKFGGKGGGTSELAQAGGLAGAPRDVIAAALELLTPAS
jgi:alanyl-tRNA synthetase